MKILPDDWISIDEFDGDPKQKYIVWSSHNQVLGFSSKDDDDNSRGWSHRNGFKATHYLKLNVPNGPHKPIFCGVCYEDVYSFPHNCEKDEAEGKTHS